MELLESLHLIGVNRTGSGVIYETTNMTILNLWLVWRGPLREDRLAIELLVMQALMGALGLFIRHKAALLIFTVDNL